MTERAKKIIVEVTSLVEIDEMDADDLDDQGNPIPPGAYLMMLEGIPQEADVDDIRDAASYHFHGKIPIACLDDFDIIYRSANKYDLGVPGAVHDLGTFPFVRSDEEIEPAP